ncbi:MAG: tRNA dimethylallyltransferase, partial [Dysgonamonadaceae bacterium]
NVPQNPELREELQTKSLDELTAILSTLKEPHNTTDRENKRRAIRAIEIALYQKEQTSSQKLYDPIDSLIIGVSIDRELRRQKISTRLITRLEEGMVEEVQNILSRGIAAEDLIYYGLEYKFVTLYVIGKLSYAEMFTQLEIAIHQFAKRQMTWFRGMERRGLKINWIDALLPMEQKVEQAMELLSKRQEVRG